MRTSFILMLTCLVTSGIFAQNYKFGKVSKEELQEKEYVKDSLAEAAVLYRKMSIDYQYDQGKGFSVITNVHERVKIYNSDGFSFGTISESLYQNNGANETISGIKAYTYNLVDGVIVESKLKKSDVFSEEVNKYRSRKKFTMPNLKVGSVIEYQYKITSPYSHNIDEIILQYDIPIVKQEVKVVIPEYYSFNERTKGYLYFNIKKTSTNGKINFTSTSKSSRTAYNPTTKVSNSSIDFVKNVSLINMNDVPALREEPFVNSMNNYRTALKFELQYTKFPNSSVENYTSNWEKVVKQIYDSESFGGQLKKSKYFKKDIVNVLQGKASEEEKMIAVFQYVQDRMHWNSYYGYRSDEGVKKAYDLKTGNIADINLILVGMLRAAKLKANPVLISTRSHGVPLFPTLEGFNYVAASVNMNGKYVFLDATNKFTKPNLLPTRALNWSGRVVKEDGTTEQFSLMPVLKANTTVMLNAEITENGDIEGKMRKSYFDYAAYTFRNINEAVDEDSYIEKLENKYEGIEVSEYVIKNKLTVGKPVVESFDLYAAEMVEFIGDKIYISPLLWFTTEENPFTLETREYPIDFKYPIKEKYLVNFKIPEGYRVESMPEPIILALPNKQGNFKYKLALNGESTLQVAVEEVINVPIISAQDYPILKEYFKTIIEKQTEKVVLSKSTGIH